MKKHFILTASAYFYFGFGFAVELYGIKAGLSILTVSVIWISSYIFYLVIAFTSLQVVKDALFKKTESPDTSEPAKTI